MDTVRKKPRMTNKHIKIYSTLIIKDWNIQFDEGVEQQELSYIADEHFKDYIHVIKQFHNCFL